MMIFKRLFLGMIAWVFALNAHAFLFFHSDANSSDVASQQSTILNNAQGLDPTVLNLALKAYSKLRAEGYDKQQMLTIIDYSKPSTERRLWVIDLKDFQVPFHELVAHGKNSGGNVPTSFSDDRRSLESSLGVFLTGNTYIGKHGESLRLNGLEPGFNDTALARDVVIHSADYVSDAFAKIHGRLGRSWGCPAVNPAVSQGIINDIKDGTVVFAYYPDSDWLHHSTFLQA